jgi:DNA adenine methylase Dam
MEYLKSPINYTGNKFKLLKQIIPLFPNSIDTFVDVFGGSGTVMLNATANHYMYNELSGWVYSMFSGFISGNCKSIINQIDSVINEYRLSKTNTEGYAKLRNDYNAGKKNDWVYLYVLCCYAFNAQGRFGSNGKFNMPFGKDRSCFSEVQRQNIVRMKQIFEKKDVKCTNLSFDEIDYTQFGKGDFIYFDPPYYGSVAVYNEKNGWTESQEKKLAEIVNMLDKNGVCFGISNNLKYGNPILEDLCNHYNTIHLGSKYNNSSYHKKDKSVEDDEVFIINYSTTQKNTCKSLF